MSGWQILMVVAIVTWVILPSLKDRVISVRKLLIMPALFIYLFYQSIIENFHIHFSNAWILLFGLALGVLSGVYLRRKTQIKADKTQKLIWLPRSYIGISTFLWLC